MGVLDQYRDKGITPGPSDNGDGIVRVPVTAREVEESCPHTSEELAAYRSTPRWQELRLECSKACVSLQQSSVAIWLRRYGYC